MRQGAPNRPRRENAQTMVEFALVFPVILLIVYGMIEFGRFLFIYSSTTSSAREGARYGAAAGDLDPTAGGVLPHYADCDGIREAAMRSGAFAGVDEESVVIFYDHGPGISFPQAGECPPFDGDGLDLINNYLNYRYDRVVVEVTTHYKPIVPLLGLFQGIDEDGDGELDGQKIVSQNARTIVNNVTIVGTPPPPYYTDTPTPTPSPTPTNTPTPAESPTPTPTNTLTPTVTNTPYGAPTWTPTSTPSPSPTPTNTPTPTPTPACTIGEGAITFSTNNLAWTLTNLSADPVRLTSVTINWPDTSPGAKLDIIRAVPNTIWSGNEQPPSFTVCETCAASFGGLESYRQVNAYDNLTLSFTYSIALPHGSGMVYAINLVFINLTTNQPCTASVSQVYP